MTATAITVIGAEAIEKAIIEGDLGSLTPPQRVAYYKAVCDSVGLNPLTKPFDYLRLNGKLVLYANKSCSDQLRQLRKVSVELGAATVEEGVYVQRARTMTPDGRHDESTGAVAIDGLKGESRANAIMKAETKAKRRATLSICGLSMPDESEVDAIPGARRIEHDPATGEIHEQRPALTVGQDAGPGAASVAGAVQSKQQLYELRAAELASAPDLDSLKKVWTRIGGDSKKAALTLDQRAELEKLKDLRKQALSVLGKPPQAPASDDFPPGWAEGKQADADAAPPDDVALDDDMPGRM